MKLYTIILAVVIINLVGFSVFYIYNFSQFSIGEFVYKIGDEGIRIGKTEGVGLPVNYLVRWDNGEYTTEYPFSLKKISWLEDKEVETFFEAQGKQVYTSYPSFGTQEEGTIIGKDASGVKKMIIFTEDMIVNNPQCLDLQEMIDEAKRLSDEGRYEKAIAKSQEAVEACKASIEGVQRPISQPKRKFEQWDLLIYLAIAMGAAILLGVLFNLYKTLRFRKKK